MKRLLYLLLIVALPAAAAQIPINLPDEVAVEDLPLCEELRVQMRATTASWSNKVCTEEFVRRGLRAFKRASVIRVADHQKHEDVETERDAFDGRFPVDVAVPGRPDPPNIMRCGDGEVEYDETIPHLEDCDDGGESADCDGDCTVVECGDFYLNVTAGEQCDDGNTDGGDGCDATCQTE